MPPTEGGGMEINMSFYVIGDIHGCYDEFLLMLEKIEYTKADVLILIGDYIDIGLYNHEMIDWLFKNSSIKVIPLKGDHELRFINDINMLNLKSKNREKDIYNICCELNNQNNSFDSYGTIRTLITNNGYDLYMLNKVMDYFIKLPRTFRRTINKKNYCIAH